MSERFSVTMVYNAYSADIYALLLVLAAYTFTH